MDLLTKDQILEAGRKLPYEDLDLPELGGPLRAQCMTGAQRDVYERRLFAHGGTVPEAGARALLIVMSLASRTGELLFTLEDVDAVNAMRFDVLDALFRACQHVNGLATVNVRATLTTAQVTAHIAALRALNARDVEKPPLSLLAYLDALVQGALDRAVAEQGAV